MFNKSFLLQTALVIAHWFVLTGAKDVCIWCDRRMTTRFMNCLFVDIISNPVLDVLERDLLLDMKSSLFAASSSFNGSPDQMKNQIMNGALAGELSGMISSHSAATGQRPEVATDAIMDLIGGCYSSVTQQPEAHFVNSLRRAVKDSIDDAQSYESQGDDAASGSNQQVYNGFDDVSLQTFNQPRPIPQENVLRNTDRQPFDNNYSERSTQYKPPKSPEATAIASSFSNRNIDDRPPVVPQTYEGVPNNPRLPNRDFVAPFENQYLDHRPSAGLSPAQENLPVNPRQSGDFSASSFSNQGLNSLSPPSRPQIPPRDSAIGPFPNQDLNRQQSFLAQPKIYETQPELLPSRKLSPQSDHSFENREPSPELPRFHQTVPFNPLPTSDGGFTTFPNKDLRNQPPFPVQPHIFKTELDNPTPNREFPVLTFSNSDFADGMPPIQETVPPYPSLLNSQLPASFTKDVDQRPYVAQSQRFEDKPNIAQQSSQFISDKSWNPVLRPPDYDYPVFTNTKVYENRNPVLRPPDNDNYPVFTNENVYQNQPSNFPAQGASTSYQAQQPSGILQPLQNNANGFDSSWMVPSKVANDFDTYNTGQQTAQFPQGVAAVPQSSQVPLDQNIPYVRTDGLLLENSKSVVQHPTEEERMNFQPLVHSSFQSESNEDKFQVGSKTIDDEDCEELSPTEEERMNFQPIVPSSYQSESNEDKFQVGSKSIGQDCEECSLQFSETLFVHLLKTKIVHSVFGTNTLPASVQPAVSEAIRRAFIDNGWAEYADQVAEYCSSQITSLPESSSTQAFADKISKSAADILYRNEALIENCSDSAISMASAISRWLEIFENEKTSNSSSNTDATSLDENQERKDDRSATTAEAVQQNTEYEYEYCDDEATDSATQNDKESDQYDYCEDDVDDSTTNPGDSILQLQKDDEAQKSKLTDSEAKRQLEILMSSIRKSITYDGFNYRRLTSTMSSIASDMGNKHTDWNSEAVWNKIFLQTIVASTIVLQDIAMSQS